MTVKNIQYILYLSFVGLFATTLHAESLLPPLKKDIMPSLATTPNIIIQHFLFSGNSIFSDTELRQITNKYQNRYLTANDLQQLRVLLSQFYIQNGYINSGVVIHDQDVSNGELTLNVIEGRVKELKVHGQTKLNRSYIADYLHQYGQLEGVFNLMLFQEALQLLKNDPRITAINAQLLPTKEQGVGLLDIKVQEAQAWHINIISNNYGVPALGSWRSTLQIDTLNLTGSGDSLALNYNLSAGLQDYNISYQRPLNASRTSVTLQASSNYANIISSTFKDLNIRIHSQAYFLKIQHPLLLNTRHELSLSFAYQQQYTATSLGGIPFSFDASSNNGKYRTDILLLNQTWAYHTQTRVLATSSLLSIGLAKVVPNRIDGRFITWLSQTQWIERWAFLNSHSLFNTTIRLSNDQLLSQDKFSIGGRHSVRGYRESQFSMDNAATLSVEWRIPLFHFKIPILSQKSSDGEVSLATFYDYANAWDKQTSLNTGAQTLSSLGIGLRWHMSKLYQFEIYVAKALHKTNRYEPYNLQDSGVHMQLSAQVL